MSPGLVEAWAYRELLLFLVWRDIKLRYKQTALGVAWVVLQPVLTMVVFSLFFGRLARMPSDGVPYPLFCFAALVPWTFTANAVGLAANSLVGSAGLITKVYFPRLLIPTAAVAGGLLDLCIGLVVLGGLAAWYGVVPPAAVVWLPAFLALGLVTTTGLGLWLSALNVSYRDVRYIVPFFIQLWMFASPVAYPSSLVPEEWRLVYGLNPMVGVVDGVRWSLLGTGPVPGLTTAASAVMAGLLLVSGLFWFRRTEKAFADLV